MNAKVLARIAFDLVIAVCILNGWWFIAVPVGIAAAWFFPYFVELIIAGVAYDAVFGMIPGSGVKGYAGTVAAIVILVALALLKKVVRK